MSFSDERPFGQLFTLVHHADAGPELGFVLPRHRREAIAREAILAAARGARIDEAEIATILAQTAHQQGLSVTEIMMRAASMAEQYTGRQAFNWRAATPDQIRRYLTSLGVEAGWRRGLVEATIRGAAREGDDNDARSSQRFDETFLRSPAGQAMQALAREWGLDWAMRRADVLRMGEEAILLFARTGFTETSFDRLRGSGFERRQILNLVKFAERAGLDANSVAEVTANSVRIFGRGDREEERRWRDLIDAYHTDPGNAEARERLRRELERMKREGRPVERTQAEEHLNLMERANQALAAANTVTAQANTLAGAHVAARQTTDSGIDDLNGAAPGPGQRAGALQAPGGPGT